MKISKIDLDNKSITAANYAAFPKLFINLWPKIAPTVLNCVLSNYKTKDLLEFKRKYANIIKKGQFYQFS